MSFNSDMTNLADAIRSKAQLSEPLTIREMAEAVSSIQTGSDVEFGILTADGTFQGLDLTGDAPVISGETKPANIVTYAVPDPERVPLTFTALSDYAEIYLREQYTLGVTVPEKTIYYKRSGMAGFEPYSFNDTIVQKKGETVQFKGDGGSLAGEDYHYRFRMSGPWAASGSVMSLLGFAESVTPYAFRGLFAYCSELTVAPELPATDLAEHCYESMFFRCTGLTAAPELPATELASQCYREMFSGCSNLSYVKAAFTKWNANHTQGWLDGTAASGTFVKPTTLEDKRGSNFIPAGWTVQDV